MRKGGGVTSLRVNDSVCNADYDLNCAKVREANENEKSTVKCECERLVWYDECQRGYASVVENVNMDARKGEPES